MLIYSTDNMEVDWYTVLKMWQLTDVEFTNYGDWLLFCSQNWGFPTRMVYLYYFSCLRYAILVGNPRNAVADWLILQCGHMTGWVGMATEAQHRVGREQTEKWRWPQHPDPWVWWVVTVALFSCLLSVLATCKMYFGDNFTICHVEMDHSEVGIARLVVCWTHCPAPYSIAGSSILWASGRGDFFFGVNTGSDSFP